MKRGYTRTELVFRDESKHINDEGRPVLDEADIYGPKKYVRAFQLLRDWIENSLQLYKVSCHCSPVALLSNKRNNSSSFPKFSGPFSSIRGWS